MTKSPSKMHGGQAMAKEVPMFQISIGTLSFWNFFVSLRFGHWSF